MPFQISRFLCVLLFVLLGALCASAQIDASSASGRSNAAEDYPVGIKESFAKQRIKAEEKDFNEMVGRSEEAAKLSDELYKSFQTNQKLTSEDIKKMDRLEKLVKKIRTELGSESDDDKDNSSNNSLPSFGDAIKSIQENSSSLFEALKKQGRFSISVIAVESSNTLLKLVRFVRQKPN